jgi:glycosyltransferase involved in cell wall biosynthesis
VTVVMPVRNEADVLRRVIFSVLSQRTEQFELDMLAVDCDSTDGSAEILAGLARQDSRLRVVTNPEWRARSALDLGVERLRQGTTLVYLGRG